MRSSRLKIVILVSICLSALRTFAATPQIQIYNVVGIQKTVATVRYWADETVIQINGLQPNSTYSLNNSINYGSATYASSVTMQSDASGMIDTSITPALTGSYVGTDLDGPFWSMSTDSTSAKPPAPSAPAYQISISQNGTQLQSTVLPQGTLHAGVQAINLAGTGLVGTLYLPAGAGPHPAVITYGGSEGGAGTGELYGAVLANAGYVTLGIAYFGAKGLPKTLANVPLEYFQKAIQYLQNRPEVQAGQIAVMGVSRGGELSLLLGATFPQIKAVVAMVPSAYLWSADDETAGTAHPNPAWLYNGTALPFLGGTADVEPCLSRPDGSKVYCYRPMFEQLVAQSSPADLENASNKVEQTQGPILLLGSDADGMWQSCPFTNIALSRLKAKNHAYNDEEVCYPNAGHMGVGVPGAPTTDSTIIWESPWYVNLGGTPAGNAAAQRNSWAKILEFLNNNLNTGGA